MNNIIKYLIHIITLSLTKVNPKLFFKDRFTRIVNMHNPMPAALDGILSALHLIAPFIAYDELIDAMESGEPLPRGFVISFDDGYKQNLELLDILDKHQCKAVFFISTVMDPSTGASSISALQYRFDCSDFRIIVFI